MKIQVCIFYPALFEGKRWHMQTVSGSTAIQCIDHVSVFGVIGVLQKSTTKRNTVTRARFQ